VKAAAHNRDARVYTTNYWQLLDGVTAIDSDTDAVLYPLNRTHATQGRYGIDVNPDSDKVYVAARDAGLIAIFNGDWPMTEPLIFKLDPPRVPFMVAYNSTTGHLFVTCGADDLVVVLDPAALDIKGVRTVRIKGQEVYLLDESNAGWVATIPVGDGPEEGAAVNPLTNRVYVTNMHSDTVSVIQDNADPANILWLVDVPVGDEPQGVGVHPGFNHIYVGNAGDNTLSIIDGVTNAVIQTLTLPGS
jgi:YVTN family beta-propeller protein